MAKNGDFLIFLKLALFFKYYVPKANFSQQATYLVVFCGKVRVVGILLHLGAKIWYFWAKSSFFTFLRWGAPRRTLFWAQGGPKRGETCARGHF